MKRVTVIYAVLLMLSVTSLHAGPGDTITVQTFTFGSAQDAWFVFPSEDTDFEKVLMYYTLRCVEGGAGGLAYDCGEWDYLTYTYLYDHTGVYDSTLLYHPNYLVNGTSPDTFYYSLAPTYTVVPHWNYTIVYDDTTTYTESHIGYEDSYFAHPFQSSNPIARTQILWRADELTLAGMSAGDISGMQLDIENPGSSLHNLRIKMKHSSFTELSPENYESSGFTLVYDNDVHFTSEGWVHFDFTTPFAWDGTSNLIVEITFDNDATGLYTATAGTYESYNAVMAVNSADRYISFTNPNYATTVENALSSISDKVTITFWAYGNADLQPQSGTCFEAVRDDYVRVLNSHTPWGDQNVYWDAGNDAGYDRIYKTASAADYEGTWTHWAFTKNATTGSMYIYKNGEVWHSGSGADRLMEDISKLWLGKGTWSGSSSYEGFMDEFAIWNTDLDASTIQAYLYKNLDAAHPAADNLLVYYHFDDGIGVYETDHSPSAINLAKIGATTHLYNAEEQFRNLEFVTIRPDVKFEQGYFTSHLDSTLVLDTMYHDPLTLILFDADDPTAGIDTTLVYPVNYYYSVYDDSGNVIDSVYVSATDVIYHEEYAYYSAPYEVINRFELARYITPYGIGLDLGEGFTWVYDVTDYLPLLKDSVHLSAGNWQEELDLKFVYIEGTPARKPLSVTNLWNGGFSYGLTPSYDDQTPDKTVTIPADAVNAAIKVRVTGHGFGGTSNCAEFCKKDHYIYVDGVNAWTKEVWRDNCDLNPVYPQGGTWVYDRANWCPGAEVETYAFELTPFVSPGQEVTLDYDAESYTWNGAGSVPYYQTEVQLITYAAPSFTLDAAVDDIISPSTTDLYSRKNPICNNPIIKIKNNGTEPLTSLQIEFGIAGYDKAYFTWEGNLAFLETEEITLPDFPWTNEATAFEVTISNPNGGIDAYTYNNTMQSAMVLPPIYPADFVLELRTNNKPNENDLFIYDASGNTILERTSFEENTTYKDTLHLTDGCYEIYLEDNGEDGLSWWANTDGTGWFKLKNIDPPSTIITFNPDFGGLVYHQFIVGNYVDIEEAYQEEIQMRIFPNPANNVLYIHYTGNEPASTLKIIDITGQVVYETFVSTEDHDILSADISLLPQGIFTVILSGDVWNESGRFVIGR